MATLGIVMPVFNGEKYVSQTIESIIASTVQPNHLVLVNDGSTDATLDCAKKALASANFKFDIVSQRNSGEATAVNVGVKRLDADYLIIVNADDPIDPDLIKYTSQALDLNPSAVVAYPDWRVIDEDGLLIREVKTQDFSRELLYGGFVCIPGPGAAIRASAIRGQLRDPRFSHVADYGTWLKLAIEGDFVRIEKVLANWRDHSQGQTAQGKGTLLAEQYVNLIDQFFEAKTLPSEIMSFRELGKASARFQAAVQGLFRAGVRSKSLVCQALVIGKGALPRGASLPLVAAIIALPFSRWGLKAYYGARKSLKLD